MSLGDFSTVKWTASNRVVSNGYIIIYHIVSYLRFKDYDMSSHCGTAETNPTRKPEVAGSIPGLAQWVKDLVLP